MEEHQLVTENNSHGWFEPSPGYTIGRLRGNMWHPLNRYIIYEIFPQSEVCLRTYYNPNNRWETLSMLKCPQGSILKPQTASTRVRRDHWVTLEMIVQSAMYVYDSLRISPEDLDLYTKLGVLEPRGEELMYGQEYGLL